MAFSRNAKYDQVIAERHKDPSASLVYLCKKIGADYQYFFRYQRNLKAAIANGEAEDLKVVLKAAKAGATKTIVRRPAQPQAQPPQPTKPRMIHIEVPEDEVVDLIVHRRKSLVIPMDKVLQAISPEAMASVKSRVGDMATKAAIQESLSTTDTISNKKKSHVSNGG